MVIQLPGKNGAVDFPRCRLAVRMRDGQHFRNRRQNLVGTGEHVMVPAVDHLESLLSPPRIPARIRTRLAMLGAVDLDDQPLFDAGKVGNVGTERMLATKAAAR